MNKELYYLMKLNQNKLNDANYFIEKLDDGNNPIQVEYWVGVKNTAESNIRALQSFGVSATN